MNNRKKILKEIVRIKKIMNSINESDYDYTSSTVDGAYGRARSHSQDSDNDRDYGSDEKMPEYDSPIIENNDFKLYIGDVGSDYLLYTVRTKNMLLIKKLSSIESIKEYYPYRLNEDGDYVADFEYSEIEPLMDDDNEVIRNFVGAVNELKSHHESYLNGDYDYTQHDDSDY